MRILVLEEQPIVALSLNDILLDLGAEVVGPALSIDHALSLAQTADMEAAVLNLWLGDHRSYPVGEVLAQRNIPFVLTSGFARHDEPDCFRHAPRVLKPFSGGELCAALMVALHGRNDRRELSEG
ncbi:MAG: response regulator [Sphingomonadales bacterium]|nr:MAG: response regulator [Sphingomonadales bacterium]